MPSAALAAPPLTDPHALWRCVHRAPLYAGRVQHWILRRTIADRADNATIARGVQDAIATWFAMDHAWGGEVLGTLERIARRRTLGLACPVVASATELDSAPTIAGDRFASVRLSFLYLGTARDMPWPVLDASGAWQPHDCVWALDLVGRCHA